MDPVEMLGVGHLQWKMKMKCILWAMEDPLCSPLKTTCGWKVVIHLNRSMIATDLTETTDGVTIITEEVAVVLLVVGEEVVNQDLMIAGMKTTVIEGLLDLVILLQIIQDSSIHRPHITNLRQVVGIKKEMVEEVTEEEEEAEADEVEGEDTTIIDRVSSRLMKIFVSLAAIFL